MSRVLARLASRTSSRAVDRSLVDARFDDVALSAGSNGAALSSLLAARQIVVTRASTGTVITPAGTVTVAANQPRIGSEGYGSGLLVEPWDVDSRPDHVRYVGPTLTRLGRISFELEYLARESSATLCPSYPYVMTTARVNSDSDSSEPDGVEVWWDETGKVAVSAWGADGWSSSTLSSSAASWAAHDRVRLRVAVGGSRRTIASCRVGEGPWMDLDPGHALGTVPHLNDSHSTKLFLGGWGGESNNWYLKSYLVRFRAFPFKAP